MGGNATILPCILEPTCAILRGTMLEKDGAEALIAISLAPNMEGSQMIPVCCFNRDCLPAVLGVGFRHKHGESVVTLLRFNAAKASPIGVIRLVEAWVHPFDLANHCVADKQSFVPSCRFEVDVDAEVRAVRPPGLRYPV